MGVPLPRTIWFVAEDIFHAETATFLAEHADKAGPLYKRWTEFRSAKIREDIEKRRAFKPEKVSV